MSQYIYGKNGVRIMANITLAMNKKHTQYKA